MSSNTVPIPTYYIFNNSQDVTSNDSNTNSNYVTCSVSRCCNFESETEEKDKTLHILDSEAKTENQFVGRRKQLATIEKHKLVREKADMNYMKTALKMQEKFSKMHTVREFRVGEHVSVRIPRIDWSCTDLLRLPCIVVKVVGKAQSLHRHRCKSGVIQRCYQAGDLEPSV